jgi:hypothetical protein
MLPWTRSLRKYTTPKTSSSWHHGRQHPSVLVVAPWWQPKWQPSRPTKMDLSRRLSKESPGEKPSATPIDTKNGSGSQEVRGFESLRLHQRDHPRTPGKLHAGGFRDLCLDLVHQVLGKELGNRIRQLYSGDALDVDVDAVGSYVCWEDHPLYFDRRLPRVHSLRLTPDLPKSSNSVPLGLPRGYGIS